MCATIASQMLANERLWKKAEYEEAAAKAGLDAEALTECLASGRWEEAVWQKFELARAAGVQGVPTFYLNGMQIVGAKPFNVFRDAFEKELRETDKQ